VFLIKKREFWGSNRVTGVLTLMRSGIGRSHYLYVAMI